MNKPIAEHLSPAGNGRAIFWLIVTTFLWGGSFVFNKLGFRDVPPIVFMTLRFSIAAVAMALLTGKRLLAIDRDQIRRGFLVGLALAGANVTFVLGVAGTTVSRAGFLNNLFVLIIPVASYLIWRAHFHRTVLFAIAIALIGLLMLAWGAPSGFNRGDLLSLLCAFFITCHILTVSRLLHHVDVLAVTTVQFATVALCGLIGVLVFPQPVFYLSGLATISLLYCVIFPTMVCFTLQNTYQRFVTPTQAGLIYTLDPIWSLLGGMIILGDRLNGREWFGSVLVLLAVAMPFGWRLFLDRRLKGRVPVPCAAPGAL